MLSRVLFSAVFACLAVWTFASSAQASDNFPGTTISGTSGSLTATNNNGWSGPSGRATGQAGEPVTYTPTGELNTLWYSWTAPGNGTVTFDTCSSTLTTFDTTLQSFTGSAVNSLVMQATNDDTLGCATTTGPDFGSRITWNVTSGTVYRIQVDGFESARGNFRLAWTFSGFSISQTVSASSISSLVTLTYTTTIVNIGATTLSGATITSSFTLSGSARTLTSGPMRTSGDTNSNNLIDTTETWVYTATFAVPQSDMDLGGTYSFTATFDTTETPALSSSAVTTSITQSPSFSNVKSQPSGSNPVTKAGQSIGYNMTITNTGNVTLTGPTIVSDTFLRGGTSRTLTSGPTYSSGDTDSDGKIDVGEAWVYTASYTVVQADMDGTGSFTNVLVYDTTQTAPVTSNTFTTPVTRTPSLQLVKTHAITTDNGTVGKADTGDIITYYYNVTNNGNQTITNISVADVANGSGSPPSPSPASVGTLAPLASTMFTATYRVTQHDVDTLQ